MGPREQLLEAWSRVRGWYPVTIAGRKYRCDPDHISFWDRVSEGDWEPQTFTILDNLLDQEAVYCDIGTWIGPTVLHAAMQCRKVYCMEPDRVAYMYLLQNLKLNQLENVVPFNIALSSSNMLSRMASPRGKRGDSMTSLLRPEGSGNTEVPCLSWLTWFDLVGQPEITAIKMDIEGGEFKLLPTMENYLCESRPGLYLSLHPHLLRMPERYAAMQRVVDVLQVYSTCYDDMGREISLETLMEEQAINRAGSYLLLP